MASTTAIITIIIKIHTIVMAINFYFIRIFKMNQKNFKFNSVVKNQSN